MQYKTFVFDCIYFTEDGGVKIVIEIFSGIYREQGLTFFLSKL